MQHKWFLIGTSRWHSLDETLPEWTTRCGARTTVEPHLVESTPTEMYPPDPCKTCMTAVAFDDVEEEPLEDAKARGYVPWSPSDSEG